MRPARLSYRIRQFRYAMRAKSISEGELNVAREVLTPKQMGLFRNMQPEDMTHALRVFQTVKARGEDNHDLLVAALLHDVGKVRCPLTVWERALIVLANRFFPTRIKAWGQGRARGWRRPFVVAEQHPYWGAQMAAECGVSPLAVNLIWRHQEPPPR